MANKAEGGQTRLPALPALPCLLPHPLPHALPGLAMLRVRCQAARAASAPIPQQWEAAFEQRLLGHVQRP